MTRRRPQQLPISGPVFFFFCRSNNAKRRERKRLLASVTAGARRPRCTFSLGEREKMETNCVKKRGEFGEKEWPPPFLNGRKERVPCLRRAPRSSPLQFLVYFRASKIERTVGKEEEIYKRLGRIEGDGEGGDEKDRPKNRTDFEKRLRERHRM